VIFYKLIKIAISGRIRFGFAILRDMRFCILECCSQLDVDFAKPCRVCIFHVASILYRQYALAKYAKTAS
jgi:hypothetical protein